MTTNLLKSDDVLPKLLYKNFTDIEHAEKFKRGNILIRRIEYHKKWEIENQRRDITENQASYHYKKDKMIINGRLTYINPVYILSTSGPESIRDECNRKFGNNEVRITNPTIFKERLKEIWYTYSLVPASSLSLFRVEYSKGERREASPHMLEPHGLSLFQKSKDHIDDDEYRFIFFCKMNQDFNFPDDLMLEIDCNEIFS